MVTLIKFKEFENGKDPLIEMNKKLKVGFSLVKYHNDEEIEKISIVAE